MVSHGSFAGPICAKMRPTRHILCGQGYTYCLATGGSHCIKVVQQSLQHLQVQFKWQDERLLLLYKKGTVGKCCCVSAYTTRLGTQL